MNSYGGCTTSATSSARKQSNKLRLVIQSRRPPTNGKGRDNQTITSRRAVATVTCYLSFGSMCLYKSPTIAFLRYGYIYNNITATTPPHPLLQSLLLTVPRKFSIAVSPPPSPTNNRNKVIAGPRTPAAVLPSASTASPNAPADCFPIPKLPCLPHSLQSSFHQQSFRSTQSY